MRFRNRCTIITLVSFGLIVVADKNPIFFTYIVRCADDTLYTGWTNNLELRLQAHNSGCGAKYTRSRAPVELIASWNFDNKPDAMKMEYAIKQLRRQEKLELALTAKHLI